MSKNYLLFLTLLTISFSNFGEKKGKLCNGRKSCVSGVPGSNVKSSCQCYCSVKCGPREKEKDDRPVYVENDPNGKYCYCKQWDLDNYSVNECAIVEKESKKDNKSK